jgi:maltose O-acetyltransferase
MKILINEFVLWYVEATMRIPGKIGCFIRKKTWGYRSGKNSYLWNNTQVRGPKNLSVGNNVSINRNCILHARGGLIIEDNVLIGPNVIIYTQNHRFRDKKTRIFDQGYSYKPVQIKQGAWIASGCIILPGVTIGQGAIIAAGSIIREDIEDYTIVTPLQELQKTKRE